MAPRLFLSAVLALSGCYCVESARSPVLGCEVEEHVVISNYGWSLFGCLPIVCGNVEVDSWCPFTFFKNEIKIDYAYSNLVARAAAKGCDVKDVFVLGDNDVLFDAYYAPVPWVIVYKESSLSANLVRRKESTR